MTKVFLFEFLCGGGCWKYPYFGIPEGPLLLEGQQMLIATAETLLEIPDLELHIPIDHRVLAACQSDSWNQVLKTKRVVSQAVSSESELDDAIRKGVRDCDFGLPICPEIDGCLETITRQLESQAADLPDLQGNAGSFQLLSPKSDWTELASDKWTTFRHLTEHHVPTADTRLLTARSNAAGIEFPPHWLGHPAVLKMRRGAGSMQMHSLPAIGEKLNIDGLELGCEEGRDWILQPYYSGLSASIGCFSIPTATGVEITPLPAVEQLLETDTFHYLGCVRLEESLQQRARNLLNQVVQSLEPFHGYIGVDLLLAQSGNAIRSERLRLDHDLVIEINPCLTTSFCETRHWIDWNGYAHLIRALSCDG